MARIQILELPMEHVGDYSRTPFAVIIDQVESDEIQNFQSETVMGRSEVTQSLAKNIADEVGAVGAIVSTGTIDVA